MLSDVSSLPPFEWEKAYVLTKSNLQKNLQNNIIETTNSYKYGTHMNWTLNRSCKKEKISKKRFFIVS